MWKKHNKKKSSKYPEPFNSLMNIATGMAMKAIANKDER